MITHFYVKKFNINALYKDSLQKKRLDAITSSLLLSNKQFYLVTDNFLVTDPSCDAMIIL